jgi:hypothetical protein
LVFEAIQALLIMDKAGIPLFFMRLDPKSADLDPNLISGFFTAIHDFSEKAVSDDTTSFELNYGARLFRVLSGAKTNLVAVTIGKIQENLVSVLLNLKNEFEEVWLQKIEPNTMDSTTMHIQLEGFREKVVSELASKQLPEKWVPYHTHVFDNIISTLHSPIASHIDGTRNITALRVLSGLSDERVLSELLELWSLGAIAFRNVLEDNDILATRSELRSILNMTPKNKRDLELSVPNLFTIINKILRFIDGRTTVAEIVQEIEEQHDRKEVRQVIEYLVKQNGLEVLSPEKRRILVVKDTLTLTIRAAEKIYEQGDVNLAIEQALEEVTSPEVHSQMHSSENYWIVDTGPDAYEDTDPRNLMMLFSEWLKVLAHFVSSLDSKKLEKFIGELTESVGSELLSRYSGHDLSGLEEFSFWLETLTSKDVKL